MCYPIRENSCYTSVQERMFQLHSLFFTSGRHPFGESIRIKKKADAVPIHWVIAHVPSLFFFLVLLPPLPLLPPPIS